MFKNLVIVLMFVGFVQSVTAQKTVYTTTGGEWIFSSANVMINGANATSIIRFSPVFNFQTQVHRDFNDKFGMITGLGLRNVGFIYDDPFNPGTRYKVRNYTIGVPIALKFGKMDGKYFFAGYELELPISFKQKTFVNDDKIDKFDEWFSDRSPSIYHTFIAGIQLPEGVQLKFKYYATNFFNKNYTAVDASGNLYKPYAGYEVNVFYVSLSFQILKGSSFVYTHKE